MAALGFAMFVAADDLTVVSTMLRPMINDVGLVLPDGLDDASWIVNVYLLAFLAVMPVAGRVADVLGPRRLLTVAYAVFAAGSVVIAATSTFEILLVGRVLTALGGGAMVPVALAVVADTVGADRRARALGTLAAIETLGWVWGPLYGAALVRFADWRWQFWLNLPLTLVGLAWLWWALAPDPARGRTRRLELVGAGLLTIALVSLDLALLGNAEIQSVTGFDQLTGGTGPDLRWLGLLAVAAAVGFVWHQRGRPDPLVAPEVIAGRSARAALVVNVILGAGLVIAMVDVPLFVNATTVDVGRAAVVSGAVLAAMTAAMALTSLVGGRWADRVGPRTPTLVGLAVAAFAFAVMGRGWNADSGLGELAVGLGVLGAGFGLVTAPTTSAVVGPAPAERRGIAASVVMVVRLLGLSVGLAGLTAWGLRRFNELRSTIDLPGITEPGFADAVARASAELTATAIADTFLAAAVLTALGLVAAVWLADRPPPPDRVSAAHPDPHERTTAHQRGAPMTTETRPRDTRPAAGAPSWVVPVAAVTAVALLGAVVAIGLLWSRLQQTENDLAQVQDDLARVEAGAALFGAQVQGFQNELLELEPLVSDGVATAIDELETFKTSTIAFDVPIDETIPIRTDVQLTRTISFPIDEVIPITQTIDTTIEIDTGLGFEVPVDVSVPVDVEVPVQLDVEVPIDETVPVEVDIPVQLDVPIEIDVAGTELELLAGSLQEGLRSLEDVLGGLAGG